jgi:hypothetical protein
MPQPVGLKHRCEPICHKLITAAELARGTPHPGVVKENAVRTRPHPSFLVVENQWRRF